MIEFPELPTADPRPQRPMSLREYAHFSEWCLRSNPGITAENCMEKRADERDILTPFSLFGEELPAHNSRLGASQARSLL